MKTRPILFSGPMVRAILNGSKTQTRRIVKPKRFMVMENDCPDGIHSDWWPGLGCHDEDGEYIWFDCPHGQIGDRLWVKETFSEGTYCEEPYLIYRADGCPNPWWGEKWSPSIHMPRRASRITLEITGVKVERINDITEEEAVKEGMDPTCAELTPKGQFHAIHGEKVWDKNPWVWVIEFRRVT